MKSAVCFILVCCFAYSSTLKMEVIFPCEMLVDFSGLHGVIYQKDITLHNHFCENFKSYRVLKQVSIINYPNKPKAEFSICDDVNTVYLTESYHKQCLNSELTYLISHDMVNFSTRLENYSSTASPHRQLQKKLLFF
jgi:hypothetical protein